MERLLKGSKHPLHNPTTATITTTGEKAETHTEIEITQMVHLLQTHTHKYSTGSMPGLAFIGPGGQLVLRQVFNTALHQEHETDSHNKQLGHPPMSSAD